MDRRHRVRPEHHPDPLTVLVDHPERQTARPGIHQLREPTSHQHRPLRPAQHRATRHQTSRLRRGDVLADRLRVHPQTRRDHRLRAPRVPVLQDLDHINHLERSPCHHTSLVSTDERALTTAESPTGGPPPRPGNTVIVQVGNYVIVTPTQLGNSVTADKTSAPRHEPCGQLKTTTEIGKRLRRGP